MKQLILIMLSLSLLFGQADLNTTKKSTVVEDLIKIPLYPIFFVGAVFGAAEGLIGLTVNKILKIKK